MELKRCDEDLMMNWLIIMDKAGGSLFPEGLKGKNLELYGKIYINREERIERKHSTLVIA